MAIVFHVCLTIGYEENKLKFLENSWLILIDSFIKIKDYTFERNLHFAVQ